MDSDLHPFACCAQETVKEPSARPGSRLQRTAETSASAALEEVRMDSGEGILAWQQDRWRAPQRRPWTWSRKCGAAARSKRRRLWRAARRIWQGIGWGGRLEQRVSLSRVGSIFRAHFDNRHKARVALRCGGVFAAKNA